MFRELVENIHVVLKLLLKAVNYQNMVLSMFKVEKVNEVMVLKMFF